MSTEDTTTPVDPHRRPMPKVIDQRQQQNDPARHHTVDPNDRPASNTKQPGVPVGGEE